MAQTQPSRDVQQATAAEGGREDGTKPQQQHKEAQSGKAGSKAPELAKSDSARKRAHQAAEAAEEALKKVVELKDAVGEVAEEETGTEKKSSEVSKEKAANGAEKTAEQEDGASKKSSKHHVEQSPGNSAAKAANGEKKGASNGASHGEGENGSRATNGGAEQAKENGSQQQEGLIPAVGEDTISLGNPTLIPSPAEPLSGHLDLNQSLQASTLAGAAQEALKAVELAVGTGQGREALAAAAARTTPAPNQPQGPAPMQEG